MLCRRCGNSITNDEQLRILDSFDVDHGFCFPCTADAWRSEELSKKEVDEQEDRETVAPGDERYMRINK